MGKSMVPKRLFLTKGVGKHKERLTSFEMALRDGDQARVDLELVTSDYQTSDIAAKADAGFSIYARIQDEGRVRRALEDSRLTQEVFSI